MTEKREKPKIIKTESKPAMHPELRTLGSLI